MLQAVAKGETPVVMNKVGGDNQLWRMEGNHLVSKSSGLVLDISGSGSGARVVMWSKHGGENQKFRIQNTMIISRRDNTTLDVAGGGTVEGTKVLMWRIQPGGQPNQNWNQIRQCNYYN